MEGYRNCDDEESSDLFWQTRSRLFAANGLYSYLDMSGKGKLVDIFHERGPAGVEQVLLRITPPYLYNSGQGKYVTIREIVNTGEKQYNSSWHDRFHTNQPQYDLELSRLLKRNNSKQLVCWHLNRRGIWGETLLHLACVSQSDAHSCVAQILLKHFPALADDTFIGPHYFGQSALHMAIVNNNYTIVQLLVAKGANVQQRATGSFFMCHSNQLSEIGADDNEDNSTKGDIAYFGEYPLSFAACLGNQEIYDFIIQNGGDPNAEDLNGNTVLHMVVIHNRTEMYRFALRHHTKPADPTKTNNDGLTPASLSAKLGRRDVFKEIINLSTVDLWKYSNYTCSVYPLNALDTIGSGGQTDWNSALMYIVNGSSDEHLDLVEDGVIAQLLSEKWHHYARQRFIQRFLQIYFHLLILSIAIYLKPDHTSSFPLPILLKQPEIPTQALVLEIIRHLCEVGTLGLCFLFLFREVEEIREQGALDYIKALRHAPPKAGYVFACLSILLIIPFRIIQYVKSTDEETYKASLYAEESLFILAVPLSWMYMLFFAGGVTLTGPFVTMIYKMIQGDMVRFAIIYGILLVGFAQVFYFVFKDIQKESISTFGTPEDTVMALIHMTFGTFKYEEFQYCHYIILSKATFVMFMILIPILLLNMLIAMMGNTYEQVISRSRKEWASMWAKIVILLERSYSSKQLLELQMQYSIGIPKKEGERGLVVIYRSKKTLASRLKGAVANWKRFYRKVMQLISEYKNAGYPGSFAFDGRKECEATMRARNDRMQVSLSRPSGTFGKTLGQLDSSKFTKTIHDAATNQNKAGSGPLESQQTTARLLSSNLMAIGSIDTDSQDSSRQMEMGKWKISSF